MSTQTKVGTGEYTIVESDTFTGSSDYGHSIALDEAANMLYVGGERHIYKLNAGTSTQLPSFIHMLELDGSVDGEYLNGMALDTVNSYGTRTERSLSRCLYDGPDQQITLHTPPGYAGTQDSIVKFSLGPGTSEL